MFLQDPKTKHVVNRLPQEVIDSFYVVTSVFNPWRYRTRIDLYRQFREYVETSGAKLMTVELALGERPFVVTERSDEFNLQLRSNDEMWFKERMLNLGIEHLPLDCKYIAWCFLGNTVVETVDGIKRIDAITETDLVKTHTGKYMPVKSVMSREYKSGSPLVEVNTEHSSVKCTPEHPFFVYRNSILQWVEASNLLLTDKLVYPAEDKKDVVELNISYASEGKLGDPGNYKKYGNNLETIEVDEDFAEFLGLYAAEGSDNGSGVTFTFNNNEKNLHEFVDAVCMSKFGRKSSSQSRWATCVKLHIKPLSNLFTEWFGRGAANKKIPDFVFNWNTKNKLAFIHGLLKGDGSKRKNAKEEYTGIEVSSKELLVGLVKLLKECGLCYNDEIKVRHRQTGFSKTMQTFYRLNIGAVTSRKMLDIRNSTRLNAHYVLLDIKNLSNKKMPGMHHYNGNYVYNLEVENDNSYIVGSTIVHNCDADVRFARPDWVNETVQLLQHYPVIQMFSKCSDLSPDNEVMSESLGIINAYHSGIIDKSKKYAGRYGHPGFAWAARREALNDLGGLFDTAILGSADYHMARALIGSVHKSHPQTLHPGYVEQLDLWQDRATQYIKGDVGYMSGHLFHYWHGKKVNRRYKDRWQILVENQYDPEFDLKRDTQGLHKFTDRNPKLRQDIRKYFLQRLEDDVTIK